MAPRTKKSPIRAGAGPRKSRAKNIVKSRTAKTKKARGQGAKPAPERPARRGRESRRPETTTAVTPYQKVVDALGEGIVTVGLDGRVRHCNPAAAQIFGSRPTEMIGRDLGEWLFDSARPQEGAPKLLTRITARPGNLIRGLSGRRRDGGMIALEVTGTQMMQPDGPLYAVILRDVSDEAADVAKLQRAAVVFEAITEGIMILGLDWHVEAVNRAFCDITGYSEHEAIGRLPGFLTHKKAEAGQEKAVAEAVRDNGRWDTDYRNQRKSGEFYSERLTVTGVRDNKGAITGYVAVFADITQHRQDEERILYQANYDALTGLPNRSLFMDRLTQAVNAAERTAHRVAVMFIDLDGFKLVNDTLGHDIGDELLREAARRLTTTVRAGDTVARLGGDEFTVIMPNLANSHIAPVVAQRIITALEEPFRFDSQEALVSASIGITVFPDDARDVHVLLRNADAAMYQAKVSGKANYRFYTADLNIQATERLKIKSGLAKALKRNEFQLDYQPRCELATGRVTGVEALLRWNSREMGPMSPAKFIPIAEETGVIGPIGEWALGSACGRQKKWRAAGLTDVRVAVNLSGRQLRQPNIVRVIADQIERAGATPDGLEIEITELIVMRDADHSAATLKHLAELGIRIILDDFGTGYSSLSVLKRFPVDMIKIDHTLVGPIASDVENLEIVRAIISMGHSLRRRVVAEGVETEAQADLLRELKCDEIQGYLVSPPVAADRIDDVLVTVQRAVHA